MLWAKRDSRAAELERMRSCWWYYTVQLHDGSIVRGIYPDNLPFLPRLMQRKVDFTDMECLDVGSAEGFLPVLAMKSGARSVLATDHAPEAHSRDNPAKMAYLKAIHGVDFPVEYIGQAKNVGSLKAKFPRGFDYINLSGVLYHVTSPVDVLAAARSLLRPDGLMLVSTICLRERRCLMEFNDKGRFQKDGNVFWYISAGFLDYMLRLLSLAPLDVLYVGDEKAGYASVLCRAADDARPERDDETMRHCLDRALELDEWRMRDRRLPRSRIATKPGAVSPGLVPADDPPSIDLFASIETMGSMPYATRSQDARILLLADRD